MKLLSRSNRFKFQCLLNFQNVLALELRIVICMLDTDMHAFFIEPTSRQFFVVLRLYPGDISVLTNTAYNETTQIKKLGGKTRGRAGCIKSWPPTD